MCEFVRAGQWVSEGERESERLYRSLGYFALVSLLKLHTLLGDYGQALNLLRHVRLDDQVRGRSGPPNSRAQRRVYP